MKFKNLLPEHAPIAIAEALKDKEKGAYLFTDSRESSLLGNLFIVVWENTKSEAGYASYINRDCYVNEISDWEGCLLGELTLSLDNSTPSV